MTLGGVSLVHLSTPRRCNSVNTERGVGERNAHCQIHMCVPFQKDVKKMNTPLFYFIPLPARPAPRSTRA